MYEEYMNNLLGIRNENSNYDLDLKKYDNNYNYDYNYMQSQNMFQNRGNDELETLYPETYKIVYPMVKKVCMQNTKPITQELVDNMTNEIYTNIEAGGDIINVNIDIGDNRESKTDMEVKAENNRGTDNRQFNNPMNDLIKILIFSFPFPQKPLSARMAFFSFYYKEHHPGRQLRFF